jgi:hypothetical protein
MTFAGTPLGWRAWVLSHPRNLDTRSTMVLNLRYWGGLRRVPAAGDSGFVIFD